MTLFWTSESEAKLSLCAVHARQAGYFSLCMKRAYFFTLQDVAVGAGTTHKRLMPVYSNNWLTFMHSAKFTLCSLATIHQHNVHWCKTHLCLCFSQDFSKNTFHSCRFFLAYLLLRLFLVSRPTALVREYFSKQTSFIKPL